MQAFVSSSYTPYSSQSFATRQPANFAPAGDVSAHSQFRTPAKHQPTNRGELIFQQEQRIRNEFIRKPGNCQNRANQTMIASGTAPQHNRREGTTVQALPELGLKIIASSAALAIILFAAHLSIPFFTQPLSTQALSQSASKQLDTETHLGSSTASTGNKATLSSGTATTESNRDAIEEETRKMNDLIAIERAHSMAKKPGESQAQLTKSDSSNDTQANLSKNSSVNLSTMTTVDLVKTGYEQLRSGSAQESIPLLSEAVRRDNNDPASRRYLGYALLETGRPAEALNQYEALRSLSGLQETDRLAVQHAQYLLKNGNKPTESSKRL
ncbi:MAG: bacterial transcriptional activator domain-containing protein [Candidatus Obscuribacterales bacterium]